MVDIRSYLRATPILDTDEEGSDTEKSVVGSDEEKVLDKRQMRCLEKIYWEKHPTHFIETTRFDMTSMRVNQQARGDGCLYGNPYPLKKRTQPYRFVLELNNDLNRIEGVGLISAKSLLRGSAAAAGRDVYENRLFNLNVYRGVYRIRREDIDTWVGGRSGVEGMDVFQTLDEYCFHGWQHIKRGNGFSKLPFVHILAVEKEMGIDLVDFLREMFQHRFLGRGHKEC